MDSPVTSEGSRSGVNWMRRKVQPRLLAMRLGEHGLAGAGHVLDQQVALAQQRHEREAHLGVLADDDPLDVGDDLIGRLRDGHWHGPSCLVDVCSSALRRLGPVMEGVGR